MHCLFKIIGICLLLTACNREAQHHFQGSALGTYYSITYIGKEDKMLQNEIDSILDNLSKNVSIFDSTSTISQINRNETVQLNPDFVYIFKKAQEVSQQTKGAFDITIAPIVNLWGFGKEKSNDHIPQKALDSILTFVSYTKVSVEHDRIIKQDPRIQLNFNAIAKGYAVDKVATYLIQKGYSNCLVDIGGEVVSKGNKNGIPWKIGIQIPTESKDGAMEADYTFELKERAVATSGNYRNYFEENGIRYSHIINPKTGRPERSNLLSVSVIADDCTTADAFATAFMVLGISQSLDIINRQPNLAAYFIYDEQGKFKTIKSPNFP
ncbi:MAG: FAD:protein FMN transferase [Bacteroidales bacterium]